MKNSKNVLQYVFGRGTIRSLPDLLKARRHRPADYAVFFVDQYFRDRLLLEGLTEPFADKVFYVDTQDEPKTDYVNHLVMKLREQNAAAPIALVGIGGGITLDVTKAVSNLLTNPGQAEDYQGWDLVKNPGIYKIGIPTLSGTGAEASRTCVMTNTKKGLKLGMNSEHSIYDQLILDPDLTRSVPRNQYFYTGMDTYIHCIESLCGSFRHHLGDAFSREALSLCEDVFESGDMQSDENREKLMVASYFGGTAIANSFVGVVHPFSAGLSVVLGYHHCIANCIVMNAMDEFYPEETVTFRRTVEKNQIELPSGICRDLPEAKFDELFQATVIHEKPLTNALGDYRKFLTREKVKEVFLKM